MEQLKATLPECRERSITYDTQAGDIAPKPGDFLVTICKGLKPGSCYQVITCKKVNSLIHLNRYRLKVFSCPDMLPQTKVFGINPTVTVKGEFAFPVYWYSRKHKN